MRVLRLRSLVALLAFACGAASLARPARATLLVAQSLSDLVADAQHVIVATGLAETSRWDQHGRIVSDVTLRVGDVAKGDLRRGQVIKVLRLGGSVGDMAMTVAGEAHVAPGERAVLFLSHAAAPGSWRVTSMALGQFPIVVESGVETVLPSGQGLSLVIEDANGALVPGPRALASAVPLADFLDVVRDLARTR